MDKDMGLNPNDLSGAAGGSREEPAKRRAQDGKELSLDELETVSGGEDRNWLKEGCAATAEAGSAGRAGRRRAGSHETGR